MRLLPFGLVRPSTIDEAVTALASLDAGARLVSGGTALVPMIRLGLLAPERLVTLHGVKELSRISLMNGTLEIGAMMSLAHLHRRPEVRAGWPLLAEAAGRVASPAIRSMGTLGGNLAYAEAASDVSPALLCLEAEIEIAGPGGRRAIGIGEFFRGFYETALGPTEMITAVRVPPMRPAARSGYVKFCSRSAEDKPLIGVAIVLAGARPGAGEVRIALGGAAPTPMRARRAESLLRGERLTDTVLTAASEAAAAEADPLSDLMGSAAYRRRMVRVWVRRLLTALRDDRPIA
jgi:carbon-monoxide dehydrogenase medium subunit